MSYLKSKTDPFFIALRAIPSSAWVFVTWLILMTLVPFLIIVVMSFMQRTEFGTIQFTFNLSNYGITFNVVYLKVLMKTLWLAFIATVSCLMVGFPIAYYLARHAGSMKQIGLVLLFIPFWTNFILRIYGIVSLLGNNGLLNQLLLHFHLVDTPVRILYTRYGVYIGLLYNYLPFLVVPIFSALEKLDPTLREAAFDLGASRIQTFFKIVLPNIKEGVFVGSLFVFIPMLGEYVIPDLLGGAKEAFLGKVMVDQFFTMQNWPLGSAMATLLSVILLFALILQNHWKKATGELEVA